MVRLFWMSLLFVLLAGPLRAELTVDSARDQLAAGDYAALEADFTQARDAKAFGQLRHVYEILFDVANDLRLAQTEAWQAAYPNSPFAATGLGWMFFHRAYLIRGHEDGSLTSREAQMAFAETLLIAKAEAERATRNDPDFLPALDLHLQLRTTEVDTSPILPVIVHSLEVAPNRQSVLLGLYARRLVWSNPSQTAQDRLRDVLLICTMLPNRIDGYDGEACMIDAVSINGLDGYAREKMLAALERRDEPYFDSIRLYAYLGEWRQRPGAMDEAMRIHRAMLGPTSGPFGHVALARRIADQFDRPLYLAEATDNAAFVAAARMEDDPQNPWLSTYVIRDILDRRRRGDPYADIDGAQRLWETTLQLGRYQSYFWSLGAELATASLNLPDPDRLIALLQNAEYYANYEPGVVRASAVTLFGMYAHLTSPDADTTLPGQTPPDPLKRAAFADAILCPLASAVRRYEQSCQDNGWQKGCQSAGWGSDINLKARQTALNARLCPDDSELLSRAPFPVALFQSEAMQ